MRKTRVVRVITSSKSRINPWFSIILETDLRSLQVCGSSFWNNLKSRNGLKFTLVTIVFSLLKIIRGLTIFEKLAPGLSAKKLVLLFTWFS